MPYARESTDEAQSESDEEEDPLDKAINTHRLPIALGLTGVRFLVFVFCNHNLQMTRSYDVLSPWFLQLYCSCSKYNNDNANVHVSKNFCLYRLSSGL